MQTFQNITAIYVREARHTDIYKISKCHKACFPNSFLAYMGLFWIRGLYSFLMSCSQDISLVAIDHSSNIVGIVSGGEKKHVNRFLKSTIKKYWYVVLFKSVICRNMRKMVIKRLILRIRKRSTRKHYHVYPNDCSCSCIDLLFIGVYPATQKKGLGTLLIRKFEKCAVDSGFDSIRLSVKKDGSSE